MKITALLGSPRKQSNSSAMAQAFLDRAGELGAQTSAHKLNDLSYRGCQGCYACKTKLDHCVLNDDLTPVLAELGQADVWVIASPIYFGQLTGQLKCCMDRFFSYLKPDFHVNPVPFRLPAGKQTVWMLAQGATEDRFGDVFDHYDPFLIRYGFSANHLLRAPLTGPTAQGDVGPEKLAEARALAERVMRG